ncbi:hypothetical protein Tsubulata_030340 [Turnera subulata]|uniref:Transmembrane protein 45B n=1 Tax=Turnera subulata TaxID=218843 RepID=A0A9Q0G7Y2_9ROSI|nr:hypothetical protein Tsubulata_030340 [Turnera subulata]
MWYHTSKRLKREALMGTFTGHIVPGLALTFLGLWHIINNIRNFCLKGSADFAAKLWYPFPGPFSKLKHLELIFILSFSALSILSQLLDFPLFRFGFRLDSFEHATMFLHLAIFAGFTLASEITHTSSVLSGFTRMLAASIFGQELFLIHFHSTDHVGLEGHYHWLLQVIVFVSLSAAITVALLPNSFVAALVLSMSVVSQGCWFLNMGFMLWVPDLIPKGCVMQVAKASTSEMPGAVTCESPDADLRARALANLQFSWILAGISLLTGFIFIKLARSRPCSSRNQSTEYEQLRTRGTEVPITIVGFK